ESAPLEMLQLRMRMQPKRAITLPDLINALEEAIKIEAKREKEKIQIPTVIEIKPPEYDIEKETKNVYNAIIKNADENGMILFSELLKIIGRKGPRETVLTLLPLLHLCQKNEIALTQEEFFGEIIIQKIGESNEDEAESEEAV
ncbi:MAG: hypothetical protein NZ903_01800, partial [Candidatus Micrarchaeota archaeon]|nr:hypothetical protein [Candidatus Micrarchaeota archaeon]